MHWQKCLWLHVSVLWVLSGKHCLISRGIVAPANKCHTCVRHSVLPAVQIGRTLVFECLDQAATYRQYVCKTLRGSPADIVTLCGNKLSGRGVVLGSGFKVVPVEQAPCRFGTIPRGQQVRMCAYRYIVGCCVHDNV